MINIALQILSDPVPKSFCAISDADWQVLARLLHANLTGDPSINYGNAKPTPDKRSLPWNRLNSDGTPDRWYVFYNGLWVSRHPLPPDATIIYAGDPANIPTFDGGNNNPVTLYDGPFWKRLPNADAKFLVQTGTTAAPLSTVLTFGQTGGEERHTLLEEEMPKHSHLQFTNEETNPVNAILATKQVAKQSNYDGSGAANSYFMSGSTQDAAVGLSGPVGGAIDDTTTPHQNMPPFLVVTFLQRTIRQYFTQAA